MSRKVAVIIIHGVGKQDPQFADGMIGELQDRFASILGNASEDPRAELVMEPVYWAPILQEHEEQLWQRVKQSADLDFLALRQLLIDFAADAIAYQPSRKEKDIYDRIHERVASVLHRLAQPDKAGADAPLAVIAHSLGSVIASNYFYDLQIAHVNPLPGRVKTVLGASPTPLESGRTFARFYTMGSPIAIWSLRYANFGTPIRIPYPGGEWLNFFDEDDIIGYPLKDLNEEYRAAVTRDIPVNVGTWLSSWNPASHLGYWKDNDVTKPIAESLARLWRAFNPQKA